MEVFIRVWYIAGSSRLVYGYGKEVSRQVGR